MQSGRLRHRITIQRQAPDKDAAGQAKLVWIDVAKRWASIEPLRGRELFTAQQINSEIDSKITLRHLDGVTAKMRVVDGAGRIYNIKSPPIVAREIKDDLVLMCGRGLNDG